MMKITAILISLLLLSLGGIVVYDRLSGNDNSGNNNSGNDNSGEPSPSTSLTYPFADILTFYSLSELEKAYPAPKDMEWVVNSDKGSGFASQSWYDSVWTKAQNIKTSGDEGVKYNKYIAAAQNNQKVAYLREVDNNDLSKDYSTSGRKMTIVFRNADGDLVVKDIPRSVDNFDLTSDVSEPTKVFKQPEATIPANDATNWLQQKWNQLNANSTAKAENKTAEQVVIKYQLADGSIVNSLPTVKQPANNSAGQQTSGITPYKSARTSGSGTSAPAQTTQKGSITPYKSARAL
jgi:hypothetical protein